MIVINKRQLGALLDTDTMIGLMAQAMRLVSGGESIQPLRWGMPLPAGGMMGMMPGYIAQPPCFGIKVVNMMPANAGTEYSSHSGCLLLFDAEHGQPLALLDAGEITARRTAAASALATDLLARKDARVLAIVGSGEQAAAHASALCAVRQFEEIRVSFRDPGKAGGFFSALDVPRQTRLVPCADPASALLGADVVCTATSSPTPVVDESMLAPGMHLNLVGACTRDQQEITTAALPLCRFFLDSHTSAWDQAGELCSGVASGLIDEQFPQGEIGEVARGTLPGRQGEDEITVYRSLGVAAQDLVVAEYVYRRALEQQRGTEVEF